MKHQKSIEVSDVSYRYGAHKVLDHITFTVTEGSYIGIIGPNGGGKTTLLKLLLGLIPSQSGSIKITGQNVSELKQKYQIGYIPQKISQSNIEFPATVYEIIESGRTPRMRFFQRFSPKDQEAIEKALQRTQITHLRNRLISDLSGGERQRVYVARALASEPKLLLLDEPFVGIDIASQEQFYVFLRELNEAHNLTILFVSHDIEVISTEVKELLCLNRRLVCQGRPKDILEQNMIEKLYGKTITHIHRPVD